MACKNISTARKQKRRAKQRRLKRKFAAVKYNPDVHCGVINSLGLPCTRVITCHIHKIFEKQAVRGRRETVRKLIKKSKINAASANASRLKGFAYDPDRHCGVPNFEGYPCMKVITCNTHLMSEKKGVQGRSKTLEKLLKMYKSCIVSTSQTSRPRNSHLKVWKRKLYARLYYNPNKNCGVLDTLGLPCLRIVTCDIHKIGQKRGVPGRSRTIAALIKHHKLVREKRTPKVTLPSNAGLVIYSPLKMILPKKNKRNNNSGESPSSQSRPQAKEEQNLGEGTSDTADPPVVPGPFLGFSILQEVLQSNTVRMSRNSERPWRTYSRRVRNDASLVQPAEAGDGISAELQEQVPIVAEAADLQEQMLPAQDQEVNLEEQQVPIEEEEVNLPELDEDIDLLLPGPGNLIPIDADEVLQLVPEPTEPMSLEDGERLQELPEFWEADFIIDNALTQQEPVASTSQNVNQNSNINILPSVPEGIEHPESPESPEPYLMPDFNQSQGGSVPPPPPRGCGYAESPIDFPDQLVGADPVFIAEIEALINSVLLAPPIESLQLLEEPLLPMSSESVVNYAAPVEYDFAPLEEIEMFSSLPDFLMLDSLIFGSPIPDSLISDSLIAELTAAMFALSQQMEMQLFPPTDELENQNH